MNGTLLNDDQLVDYLVPETGPGEEAVQFTSPKRVDRSLGGGLQEAKHAKTPDSLPNSQILPDKKKQPITESRIITPSENADLQNIRQELADADIERKLVMVNGEPVEVAYSKANLIEDFVQEAVAQNIDEQVAREYAAKITVDLKSEAELGILDRTLARKTIAQVSRQLPIDRGLRRTKDSFKQWLATPIVDFKDPAGSFKRWLGTPIVSWADQPSKPAEVPAEDNEKNNVATIKKNDDTKAEVTLNMDRIAKAVDNGFKEGFQIPKELPPEYRQKAFEQFLDAVWRHERQHLIQEIREKTPFEKVEDKLIKGGIVASASAFGAVMILDIVCDRMQLDPQVRQTLRQTIPTILTAGAGGMQAVIEYNRKYSSKEKEAFKLMKDERNGPLPFKVGNPE